MDVGRNGKISGDARNEFNPGYEAASMTNYGNGSKKESDDMMVKCARNL